MNAQLRAAQLAYDHQSEPDYPPEFPEESITEVARQLHRADEVDGLLHDLCQGYGPLAAFVATGKPPNCYAFQTFLRRLKGLCKDVEEATARLQGDDDEARSESRAIARGDC